MGIRIEIVNGAGTALRMNDGTADADGTLWWVHEISGWGARTPSVRAAKRMASNGSVVTNATYGNRSIRLSGVAVATTSDNVWLAMQRFETACDAVTADGKVRVYEASGTRHALARITSQPTIAPARQSPLMLNWSVSYTAFNPVLQAGA